MPNPQDSKTKKTQSASIAGPGPDTAAAKNIEPEPTPSSGHDRPQHTATAVTGNAGTSGKSEADKASGASGTKGTSTRGSQGQGESGDQPIGEKISSTASGIMDKAKETASGTYDAVANGATSMIQQHKGDLSSGLKTLASTIRNTRNDLSSEQNSTPITNFVANYTGPAARQIDKVAGYIDRKNWKDLMRDTEGFARRNPAIFIGAAFALGMVAARFLKSSPPRMMETGRSTSVDLGAQGSMSRGSEPMRPAVTNP